jgi:hypothetical protein
VPEFHDRGGRGGRRLREWSDETRAAFEEGGGAVFPAGFFGAGHRVGADEVRVGREGGVTEAGNFAFYAADVGDGRAGRKVGGDLTGEGDYLVNGGGEDDEVGATDGFVGGFGDGVAPRLIAKFQTRLGTARPEDNARRDAAGPGGTGDGTSEEAGSNNRELSESAHRVQKTQKRRTVSSPTAEVK